MWRKDPSSIAIAFPGKDIKTQIQKQTNKHIKINRTEKALGRAKAVQVRGTTKTDGANRVDDLDYQPCHEPGIGSTRILLNSC